MIGQKAGTLLTESSNSMAAIQFCGSNLGELPRAHSGSGGCS